MLQLALRFGCLRACTLVGPAGSPSSKAVFMSHQHSNRSLSVQRKPAVGVENPKSAAKGDAGSEEEMDDQQQQLQQPRDIMSHSFGVGYSTRCNEEGFGGIYGESQSLVYERVTVSQVVDESHPDYDRSQGSDVKEKEKGRNSLADDATS